MRGGRSSKLRAQIPGLRLALRVRRMMKRRLTGGVRPRGALSATLHHGRHARLASRVRVRVHGALDALDCGVKPLSQVLEAAALADEALEGGAAAVGGVKGGEIGVGIGPLDEGFEVGGKGLGVFGDLGEAGGGGAGVAIKGGRAGVAGGRGDWGACGGVVV